ncbi:MAG: TetR/AcrR family transcriptional regulator [bacterium]|nr:TetR/AcrR family transcriptional regulator [bacterium]
MPTKPTSGQQRRPHQRRARETVEVILRATAHILSRDGLGGLTTNRVAEKAGVSIGSLYQYFPDKEALVAEVRRRYDDAFRERMLALVGEAVTLPLAATIARGVRTLIALHAEDPGLHNAVSAGGLAETERRLLHQVAAGWLEAHRDEVRRPDRALAAAVALDVAEGIVHGVALRDPDRLARDDFAAEVIDLLVRYLVR